VDELTPASTWRDVAGVPISDALLDWPPDVFALTNVLLGRTEAFRFALSRFWEWPPSRFPDWIEAVGSASRDWSRWAQDHGGEPPELVVTEWGVLREGADLPLERISSGEERALCEALLTLHATADEACAGLGVALDSAAGDACVYRARGRELLVRTGSMARLDPRRLRVLPKVRTPRTGRASFSRYACVQGPGIDARWYKFPTRHRGTDPQSEYASLLLLPWPLRVRESDFRAVGDSVRRLAKEPYGFFEFAPSEGLDLDLVDRVLVAALEEANSVDVVLLPESAVHEDEIDDLEALLAQHGVAALHAGVRGRAAGPGQSPRNGIHLGVNPSLEKPARPTDTGTWWHVHQRKHHRWALDEGQIYQYHLGGVLHPRIRWWETMDVPRRAVEFVEVAELTFVDLVCEDLAQSDEIPELIRAVGPTLVLAVLLDGPQLSSRWSARYASVLADDPGSAVLTLSSYGMVQRSRPLGRDASQVVASWKDPARGARQIPLESGAHAVLLNVRMDRATRRSADGRSPVDTGTHCFDVAVYQVRASSTASGKTPPPRPTEPALEVGELAVLTAWAEGVAEALIHAPERSGALLAEARRGAEWRAAFELPEPSPRLSEAIDSLERVLRRATPPDGAPSPESVLASAGERPPEEPELEGIARRALLAMVEQRRTRQPIGTAA
jgi:hypothetical protein